MVDPNGSFEKSEFTIQHKSKVTPESVILDFGSSLLFPECDIPYCPGIPDQTHKSRKSSHQFFSIDLQVVYQVSYIIKL